MGGNLIQFIAGEKAMKEKSSSEQILKRGMSSAESILNTKQSEVRSGADLVKLTEGQR